MTRGGGGGEENIGLPSGKRSLPLRLPLSLLSPSREALCVAQHNPIHFAQTK